MAGEHGEKKDQLLELSKKISDLFNNLLPYAQFVKVVKGSSEYSADTDVNKSTTEMEEVVDQYKISLEKLQNYLRGVVGDFALNRGAIDLIEYLSGGTTTLSAEAKNFASGQGIVLQKNLSTGTVDVKIEESTLSSYKTTISGKTISVRGKLDKIEKLSKLKNAILIIDEKLGDLNYDTEEKDTIAGTIKRYKAEWYKDKISLKVMEEVFPQVKDNLQKVLDKTKEFIVNIDTVTTGDIDKLEKAVKFLEGTLALDPATKTDIDSIISNFSYSKTTTIKALRKSNRRDITSEVNIKTLEDRRNDLYNYGGSLTDSKGFINRHKKGVRNTLITLAVIGALAITGVLSYIIPKAVKGEEKPAAQENPVDSGLKEDSDLINTEFIKHYQDKISSRIAELQQKAQDEGWEYKINGQEALKKLQEYVEGENDNWEAIKDYDEESLSALSSQELITARSLIELAHTQILNDLDAIEDSVGGMLTQNISKDVFEQVNFTKLKTAAGNSIQSVSIDFVKDEDGNYDSKMEIVVKSYDSMTKKEFYKYFVISTEDALTYLTDGELLDVNAIQAIQDNGKITESGIDYKYILENEGTYLPQEVSHIYMNGVSEAIKKGKYTVSYKVVLADGTEIQGATDVENRKATNQTAVIKAVYKHIFSLIESKIEANESQM